MLGEFGKHWAARWNREHSYACKLNVRMQILANTVDINPNVPITCEI